MSDELTLKILEAENGPLLPPTMVGLFKYESGDVLYLPFIDDDQFEEALDAVEMAFDQNWKCIRIKCAEKWHSMLAVKGLQFLTPMTMKEYEFLKDQGLLK